MCPRIPSTSHDHVDDQVAPKLPPQPSITIQKHHKESPDEHDFNSPTCSDTIDCPNNNDLIAGLKSTPFKCIPVRFLYDDKGSDLYEDITALDEYYPFKAESELLLEHADDIISNFASPTVVVELGCGDGSKTSLLLQALVRRDKSNVRFVGIDVSSGALQQAQKNLRKMVPEMPAENLEFIAAEYLQGLKEARQRYPDTSLCILWLGSSVGNFEMTEAAAFVRKLGEAAGDRASLLLCTDLWKDTKTLHAAYDDSVGVTKEFILNGMTHAMRTLNHPGASSDIHSLFAYDAVVNTDLKQVEMWLQAKQHIDDILPGVCIKEGERILMEVSRKFTPECIRNLALDAGMVVDITWSSSKYSIQLLLHSRDALQRCWNDTDALFTDGVDDWTAQPIGLRHPFLFYYGHVAAFSRLRLLHKRHACPMDTMMSRGIDPIVLDPSQCHSHPDAPEHWPSMEEIKVYATETRRDILEALEGGLNKTKMKVLMMCLEHERMHQETLCYMLAQQRKRDYSKALGIAANGHDKHLNGHRTNGTEMTKEQGGVAPFYFGRWNGYKQCAVSKASSRMVTVPKSEVMLGIPVEQPCGFVWDNELGTKGPVAVESFSLSTTPVTNAEFYAFALEKNGYNDPLYWTRSDFKHLKASGQTMPATWSTLRTSNGTPPRMDEVIIHLPEGSYLLSEVSTCPVYCSLMEAQAYCKAHGGRIMTESEYVAAHSFADDMQQLSRGGWEWTSSVFEPFDGFKPNPLYPEYSTDFFDACHYTLRGSSPFTHPSMCRFSFRNYYQSQYPYVFAKFRMVQNCSTKN